MRVCTPTTECDCQKHVIYHILINIIDLSCRLVYTRSSYLPVEKLGNKIFLALAIIIIIVIYYADVVSRDVCG